LRAAIRQPLTLLESGGVVKTLHWLEVGLLAEPGDRLAVELRLCALAALLKSFRNLNESGWLNSAMTQTTHKLESQRVAE